MTIERWRGKLCLKQCKLESHNLPLNRNIIIPVNSSFLYCVNPYTLYKHHAYNKPPPQ